MKNMKYLSILLPLCFLVSCDRLVQPVSDPTGEHRCELRLDGGITGYAASTRAEGDFRFSPQNRLYLRMTAGGNVVLGEATYREDTGNWTLTYSGSLGGATQGTAEAVLLARVSDAFAHIVKIDYTTPVFEDKGASFTVDDAGITLSATLTPKTGRISFVHDLEPDRGRWFNRMAGLAYYDAFNLSDFKFSIKESVLQDGFWFFRQEQDNVDDEYFYGFFMTPENPYIMFYDSWSFFLKHFLPETLTPGQSGFVNTWDLGDDWDMYFGQDIWLDGFNGSSSVNLRMRYVPAGTFRMGEESSADARPVHAVTLPHYYIGETEVTRAMWYNVMGEPGDYANNPAPVSSRSYDDIQTFIAALNRKTDRRFRLPTEAEWEFAARGGILTYGYTYSGGNSLDKVARMRNERVVGTLAANELGLFDMSGNIAELCSDWYGPYADAAAFNPTGPSSGTSRVVRGGDSYDGEDRFPVWARARTSDYAGEACDEIGFRLVMEVPPLH